ncbi:hypothetical protein E2P81_ATG02041 [Venturia nashicola]|uniref:F-box domain-containing protein n=1 Tax=Venturia nashicola TaxID=86259 RepID=A0A4Z1PKL4_9PEZI|nr:hypothetical protein E6O75_ATG02086 [Venturia nashicola]TLD35738.1 hypothetical protein E2P81_ATG02041 [Venturia nashicola]
METSTSQLLNLADELLVEIISQVHDRQALCALSRTCSRLQNLTQDLIYETLLIRNGTQARSLAQLFASGRARPRAVHDLQIRWPHTSEDGIEDIDPLLKDFTQLKHLRIESPCCNDGPWIDQPEKPALPWMSGGKIDISGLFEIALSYDWPLSSSPLGNLQSLTLHSHGSGEDSTRYELGEGAIIFLLPTLRYIMLSCFDIGMHEDIEEVLSRQPRFKNAYKTTALKTLVFEECNIHYESFETLLKLPQALRNLTVGERMYHTSEDVVPMGFRSNFLEFLEPQRSTITYFKHIGGGRYWSHAHALHHYKEDITFLSALETIELGPALGRKYISHQLSPTLRKVRFLMTFPTDLGLENSFFDHPFWSSTFKTSDHLHHIDLVLYRTTDDEFWNSFWRRESVNSIARRLREQNTEMAIYQPKFCKRSLIPPYMYGEEMPEEELLYVSSSPNTFGDRFYELAEDSIGDDEGESYVTTALADEVE